MINVFMSYKHDDNESVNAVRSIRQNPNNTLQFIDRSLAEPVLNAYGDINRRSPHDMASNTVNHAILDLLRKSDKLLVLIGKNTHSSEWVNWEIKQFRKIQSQRATNNILLMRVPHDESSGKPSAASDLKFYNWHMNTLKTFLGI